MTRDQRILRAVNRSRRRVHMLCWQSLLWLRRLATDHQLPQIKDSIHVI